MSSLFREQRFKCTISDVLRKGDIKVLEWWVNRYKPPQSNQCAFVSERAIEWGSVKVLAWLQANGKMSECSAETPIICQEPQILQWIHRNAPDAISTVALEPNFNYIKWMKPASNRTDEERRCRSLLKRFKSIWQNRSSDFTERTESNRIVDEERYILRQLKWLRVN